MFVLCSSCGKPVAVDAPYCLACGQQYPSRGNPGKSISRGRSETLDPWRTCYEAGLDSIAREDFQTALARLGEAIVAAPRSKLAICHATRAYAYLGIQQYERALSDCDEAIRLNPQDAEALAWRGSAMAGLGRWRESIEDLKLAAELAPEEVEYEQVALSHTENAIADFRERVKRGESSCQLFYDRGVIYAFRGEFEKAIRDFTQAIEADATHALSYLGRARCLFQAGRHDEALADCSGAIDRGIAEVDAFRLRSNLAECTGDLPLALADLSELLKRLPHDLESLRRRAQIYSRQREFARAHRDYTRLLRLPGVASDLYVARGLVRSELGDYWGAIADFSRSLDDVPADAETLSLRGEARLAINRTKEALEDFEEALALNSTCTAARRGRALVFSACGKPAQALAQMEKTLRLDPRYGMGFAARGRIYQESGQLPAAIKAYDQALQIIQDGRGAADVYYRRAICRAALEDWKAVESDLNQAIQRRPNHPGSHVWRANARFRSGDWIAAINDLAEASRLNPDDSPHYRKLAEAACGKAIAHISRLIDRGQPTPSNYCDRGIVRHFLGELRAALRDFASAIEAEPTNLTARTRRANILRELGDVTNAAAEFQAAIELDADDADLRLDYARCQLQLGNNRDALEQINLAIGLAPHLASAYLERARILARHGKSQSALTDLGRAISLAPHRADAFFERARIRLANEQTDQAIEDLNWAIERNPRSHDALLMRAELLSRAGMNDRALADFETAIKLNGQSIQAHCGSALALARLDKHDVALRELTKVLRLFSGPDDLATLLSCRAKIAYNAGEFRRAQSDFATAAALDDDPRRLAQTSYGLGLALHQLDQPAEARGALRTAIQIDANCQPAAEALRWLERKQGTRPGPLNPLPVRIKIHAPAIVRGVLRDAEADADWDADPPWNLWLVTRQESETEFGPVEKADLDRWCQEGRIDENTLVLRSDWDQWRWASEIYPQLGGHDRALPAEQHDPNSELADEDQRVRFPDIQV